MNIYWCGGEDIDFPGATQLNMELLSTYFRSGYARIAISNPSLRNSLPFESGELTSAFATIRAWLDNGTSSKYFGLVKSGSGGKGIYFGTGAANLRAAIWIYDGTTWTKLAEEAGASLPYKSTANGHLIMQLSSYGASATVKLFHGATELLSYSGDVSIAGVTGFDAFGWGGAGTFKASECIVCDLHPSTLSLVTHYPNAAGDANAWTGAYTDIDEAAISDADAVYVDSAAQDAQFNLRPTPAGTFAVDAIKIVARACKTGDAAVGTVALGVKSDGTVDVDAGHALTTAWETYERIEPTINGSQLTTALLDALQLNLRSAA